MGRNFKMRVVGLLLAMSLLLSGLYVPVDAKTADYSRALELVGRATGHIQTQQDLTLDTTMAQSQYNKHKTSFPSSYDLRTQGLVTSVKDQGNYGMCWTFAAAASMESNALKKGLGNFDLSERALGYFTFHDIQNKAPGLEGDIFWDYFAYYGEAWYNIGGNSSILSHLVSKGYGPILESDAPYSQIINPIDESLAYGKNALTVTSVNWMEGSDMESMKDAIMTNGAIVAGVYVPEDEYEAYQYYNSEGTALYVPYFVGLNHDITIVGWDDNYSRDNFGVNKPSGNGAWLCKNSWGIENQIDGYFWMSYEDACYQEDWAYSYTVEPSNNYGRIYQYDGGISTASVKGNKTGNLFTAEKDEYIDAVRFFSVGYEGTINVYTDCENKIDGNLVYSQGFTSAMIGWDTVNLNTPIAVAKGQKFAIILDLNRTSELIVDVDVDNDAYGYTVTVNAGESWFDLGDGRGYITFTDANARVKALGHGEGKVAGKLTTKTEGSAAVNLSWTKDNDAQSYDIYRKTSSSNYKLINSVQAGTTTYKDSNLTIGTKYTYKVVPVYEDGTQGPEMVSSIKTILAKPTNLKVAKTSSGVKVSWTKASKATKYQVYRKVSGGSYTKIATVGNVSSYVDKKAKKGKTYYYKVYAVASNGVKSEASSAKSIKVK